MVNEEKFHNEILKWAYKNESFKSFWDSEVCKTGFVIGRCFVFVKWVQNFKWFLKMRKKFADLKVCIVKRVLI